MWHTQCNGGSFSGNAVHAVGACVHTCMRNCTPGGTHSYPIPVCPHSPVLPQVEHIEDCLQKYTETLSSSLMQTTMFQDQRIAEEGFGLKPLAAPFNKMPLFHGWYMRGLVTRKTLLPAIAECFEKAP